LEKAPAQNTHFLSLDLVRLFVLHYFGSYGLSWRSIPGNFRPFEKWPKTEQICDLAL